MMKELNAQEAMKMITTRPVMIITTLHDTGIVNAGVFGSYTNLSSDHLGAAVHRGSHTYRNILRSHEFAVNVPGRDIVESIKVLASDIPEDKSELEEAGLTPEKPSQISVPHIKECVASIECIFEQEVKIGGHSFLIAKSVGGFANKEYITPQGKLDVLKAEVFHCHRYPEDFYMVFGEEIPG